MKIVVNTRLLRKNAMDGIGWVTYNTMKYIVEKNPEVEFHFLFDSGIDDEFLFGKNVIPHNLFPPAKHALLNVIWFQWSVKQMLKKINPDLFLSPDGNLCLGWSGKQYSVISDINFFHNPQDLKWSNAAYYNRYFPKFAKKATRIGTISDFSKQDIVKHYQVNPEKIDIIYCGLNNFYKPVSNNTKDETKQQFTQGADYFVFVGTLQPRKNVERLLQAFDHFKKESQSNLKLVIAGKFLFKVDEIMKVHGEMMFKDDVVFTGRIDDDQLNAVLGSALALTFVPYFEGFGLPILEAMQCDVPVICSNITSMPEVAGDAALLVDPFDISSITNAMLSMYNNELLRNELIIKGRLRKDVFTWEQSASLLWQGVTKCF